MPLFNYVAVDNRGQKIKGQIAAKDNAGAVDSLRKNQMIIVSIKQAGEKEGGLFQKGGGNIKLGDLVVFTRQLSALVKAGIPLVRGLNILSLQVENSALRKIINSLVNKIETGSSLSDAMANYSHIFSHLYVNMIKAGEFSGALDSILDRLAEYLEDVNALNRKVRAAFVYPTVIVIAAVLITAVIFIKVVPAFKNIFDTLQTTLPLLTRLVFQASEFFRKGFLFFIVIAVSLVFTLKALMKMPRMQVTQDKLKLNLPVIGRLMRKVIIARFSRTLSTLLKSGVSILAALDISGKTSGNKIVEGIIESVINQVSKGERIGQSLGGNRIFPPLVVNLIAVGEETGDIGAMLDKIAFFYEEEVDNAVAGLTSLIEPFIIIFLGILIGTIVLAIFLPILQLTRVIGGGM